MKKSQSNFPLLTGDGLDAIGRLLDPADTFHVRYGSFAQVLPEIERLWSAHA